MRWGIVVLLALFCVGCIKENRVKAKTPERTALKGSAYCFVAGVELEGVVIPMEGCTPSYKLCRRAQWTAERYGGYANVTWLSQCTFTFKSIAGPRAASVNFSGCGVSVRAENDLGSAIFAGIKWKRRQQPCN